MQFVCPCKALWVALFLKCALKNKLALPIQEESELCWFMVNKSQYAHWEGQMKLCEAFTSSVEKFKKKKKTYKKPYFVMHPLDCRRHHRHKCLKVLWKHSFCLAGRICVTIFVSDLAAFYSSIPVLHAAFFIFHKQSGWKKVHISQQLRAFASRISHSGQVSKHSSLRNDITDYLGHNF